MIEKVCHTHTAAFLVKLRKKSSFVFTQFVFIFRRNEKISANWRQQSAVWKWCGRKKSHKSWRCFFSRAASAHLSAFDVEKRSLFVSVSRIFWPSLLKFSTLLAHVAAQRREKDSSHFNCTRELPHLRCIFRCDYTI